MVFPLIRGERIEQRTNIQIKLLSILHFLEFFGPFLSCLCGAHSGYLTRILLKCGGDRGEIEGYQTWS